MCEKMRAFFIEYWVRPNQYEAAKLMTSILLSTVHDYYIDTISE